LGYLLLVCKISAQYVNFYLVFIDSEKNNFSADVYVHLAGGGLTSTDLMNVNYLLMTKCLNCKTFVRCH
jgi:hypothetical protein